MFGLGLGGVFGLGLDDGLGFSSDIRLHRSRSSTASIPSIATIKNNGILLGTRTLLELCHYIREPSGGFLVYRISLAVPVNSLSLSLYIYMER